MTSVTSAVPQGYRVAGLRKLSYLLCGPIIWGQVSRRGVNCEIVGDVYEASDCKIGLLTFSPMLRHLFHGCAFL